MELEAEDVYAALVAYGMSATAAHLEYQLEAERARAFINPPAFTRADVEVHLDALYAQGRIVPQSDCGSGTAWTPAEA